MHNQITPTSGAVDTLTLSAPYVCDPLALYEQLTENSKHTLLLESAEIADKSAVKSLLLVNAAVRISCNEQQVIIKSLTLNGQAILPFIVEALTTEPQLTICHQSTEELIIECQVDHAIYDERARLKCANPLTVLRIIQQIKTLHHHKFSLFLAGVMAFDLMAIAEPLPSVTIGENHCDDFVFYLSETLVVIDHEKRSSEIIAQLFSGESQQKCYFELSRRLGAIAQTITRISNEQQSVDTHFSLSQSHTTLENVAVDINDEDFCSIVEKLKQHIREGDIFQVVPSRTFSLPCHNSLLAYRALKITNPSPYMFYLNDSDFTLFGASPESALKFDSQSRQVEIYPIAGTRPRGRNPDGSISLDLDSRIELALRQDQKELAEHLMLVDLARNDIARVSEAGTRFVADLLKVDRYSHVMHLVSRVCGKLASDLDALHAYQACMNMGTLSGAPKVEATTLIRQYEQKRRGSYGGAVGYLTGDGDMDTCIVIRSAFVSNNIAYIQAGAGVVFDSNPQAEANETRQKAQAVINAISMANAASQQQGAK